MIRPGSEVDLTNLSPQARTAFDTAFDQASQAGKWMPNADAEEVQQRARQATMMAFRMALDNEGENKTNALETVLPGVNFACELLGLPQFTLDELKEVYK